MTCEHKRLKHGYEKTHDVQWCLDCGVITHSSDGLIGPGLHKRTDWSNWINVNLEAWSCRNEAHDGKRCSHWCGGATCPASIRSVATTTQNDSISVSEVPSQKPDWDAASEAMRWLNDIEAMQGGRNGPTIKLRAAIKAMQTEAANALYMVRADKAQALMEAEKAMAQIREATAEIVKERDLAAAQAVLPCGHHHSLMLESAETGEPLYCELCDCISRRNDAETMEAEARAEAAALRESIQAAVAAEREACARTCERLAEERFAEFGVTEPDTNASYYTGRDADEYELHHEEDDACAQAIRAREPQDEPVCELIALDDGLGTVIAQWNEARAGWERECADGDKLCEALGISMTEGGSLQVAKMVNAIAEARRDQARYRELAKRYIGADFQWGDPPCR